jgi:hypothetical protein
MALHPTKLLGYSSSDRSKSAALPARARSQSVQRLQVGLVGLAAMILLVGLASLINSKAQQNEPGGVPAVTSAAGAGNRAASDPLADAGVVPDMPSAAAPASAGNADVQPSAQH